jgi:hypothetical protein
VLVPDVETGARREANGTGGVVVFRWTLVVKRAGVLAARLDATHDVRMPDSEPPGDVAIRMLEDEESALAAALVGRLARSAALRGP